MNAPWHDPTPEAWMVYSDYCADAGRGAERLRALRYAEGLRKRPQMVLVCDIRESDTSVLLRLARRGEPGWRAGFRHRWLTPSYCDFGSNWYALTDWTCTPRLEECLATPADFPGMTDDLSGRNVILRSFYYRTSYDIRIGQRDGRLVVRTRGRRGYRDQRELGIHA